MAAGRKETVDRQTADRDSTISAARRLGVEGGWSAVTVRALTQSLGYIAPIVYEHFHNKRDVLTQVAIRAFGELYARLEGAILSDVQALIQSLAEE